MKHKPVSAISTFRPMEELKNLKTHAIVKNPSPGFKLIYGFQSTFALEGIFFKSQHFEQCS
jgi:hypothetical protein